MNVIATHINYFFVCKRKLWLFANGINMEHTSDTVGEGKLIHETSYPDRSERYEEVSIGGSKIDFFDARGKVIHEIKKSDSMEDAHIWQVKYYIWLFEQEGIDGVTGIIEYPIMRHREHVALSNDDRERLKMVVAEVEQIVSSESCPPKIGKKFCLRCSYYEFCYASEE